MADIATLGIAVDSSQVKSATAALQGLAAAATPATAATVAHSAAHGGLSTQAMAAGHAVRSMAEGLAMGIPVTQMLGQQINHLSYAASGPGGLTGAFKQVAGSLFGFIGPMGAAALGLAAVGAAGYFAYSHIKTTAMAFDDASRAIGITSGELQALQAAAANKGIASADFLKAMEKFGSSVYDAQHGMGQLAESFRASGQSADGFVGYLGKVADRIKSASSDTQRIKLLQEAGLPSTMEWVRLLSLGGDAIKKAVSEADKFANSAEAQLVAKAREFDEKWNETWTNWENRGKRAILSIVDAFAALKNAAPVPSAGGEVGGDVFNTGFGLPDTPSRDATANERVKYGFESAGTNSANSALQRALQDRVNGQEKPIKTLADRQKEIQDAQTLIGLYGQTATSEQAAEQVRLHADATYLSTGVAVSREKIAQLQQLARETALGITQTKAQADAYGVEAATVGMAVGQAAEYAAVQNKINEQKRLGNELSPQALADIRANAAAMGQAAQTLDTMRSSYEGLVRGPMQAFTSAISQGATAMDAFKKAGQSALNAIATKLTDMAAQNLWSSAFGGSSGGGLLGSLFGGKGSNATDGIGGFGPTAPVSGFHSGAGPGDAPTFTRFVHPAYFDDAPRFHSGIGPGEQAAIIRKDESVLTPGQMRALGNMTGGQHVTVGVTVDDAGKLQAYVKSVSQQSAADGVNSFATSPAFIDHVAKGYQMARTQRKV